MFSRPILVLLALTMLVGLAFGLWPQLDLAMSGAFYGQTGFAGDAGLLKALRGGLYYLPSILLGLFALGWLLAKAGAPLPPALRPRGRSLLYLALGFALGPGLLVNVALKDHWHRPRPVQVREFGGEWEFRPWYRTDGACPKNCSFVSGETSAAFWLAAPASLAPPPLRPVALAAAIGAGLVTAGLRVAFGGHFPSDVLFAGLFTLLLVAILHRLMIRPVEAPPDKGRGLRGGDPHL